MDESADHYVGSLYTFNAPDELIESFKATEDSNKCQTIEYKDGASYPIDQILKTFLAIYSNYVETESLARPADAFELPKLNRGKDTVTYEDAAAIYELDDAYSDGTGEPTQKDDNLEEEMTLIDHENITRVYKRSDAFDMQLLKRLEGLTRCAVEVKDETNEIFVKGDTAEDVERMCAKLSIIDQAYSRYTNQRLNFDYYNSENEANFKFHFYRVEKLIDRRIQADHPAFYFEYLELTLVKYVEGEWKPYTARSHLIEAGETSVHPWIDFVYPALGNDAASDVEIEKKCSTRHGYLASEKVLTLTSWTEKIPIRPANAFEAVPVEEASNPEVVPMTLPSRKDYVKSKRVVKGQADAAHESAENVSQELLEPPPIEPPHMPFVVDLPVDETKISPNIASGPEEITLRAPTYCKRGSLIDHPEPTVYVPAKFAKPRLLSHWPNAQEVINQKDNDMLRDLNNFVEIRASAPEKLQETSEPQSRKYKRNPILKATKSTVPDSPCPSLVSRITDAMSTIFETARTSYGRLKFDVAIGCIYVKRTNLAREIQTGPFAQAHWSAAFQTRSGGGRAQTLFSSPLTACWVDASFLVDLKLKDNTRVFSKTPVEVRVKYLIKCVNKHRNNEVVVEIDQDGKYEFYDAPRTIGSVNCYYPKRVWDTTFSVTESSVADISLQDPVKAIVDSFWVRSSPRISLGGRISGPEIGITNIHVHRQTSHQSTANSDLFLRLTEVQDLIVQQHSPQQFRAYAAPEDKMIEDDNRVWWEASISSRVADSILLENRQLELGEIAQWSPDDITGMAIIEDMFRLSGQVVTRIDSVGYGTKGVSIPQQAPGTARSATKSTMTGRKDRFAEVWADW
ncbi:hypothetical protein MMC18_000881 [Xylographa bjoerkii]|nr:hypothetical protein [Xylographa bjoerkii]